MRSCWLSDVASLLSRRVVPSSITPSFCTTNAVFPNSFHTSALAAILFGEPESDLYTQTIHDADRCLISAANFIELSIVIEGQTGTEALRQCDMFFRRAGIVIEPVTVEQAHLARQAFHDFGKGRLPAGLNFGDCFTYALARVTGEPLLFKGDDFRRTDVIPVL